MNIRTLPYEIAYPVHCWIGEGPLWDERTCTLIQKNEDMLVTIREPGHEATVCRLQHSAGSFGLTEDGRIFGACGDTISMIHEDGSLTPMHAPVKITAKQFNDGKVGPDGRFYAGTIYGEGAEGGLYRLDTDGSLTLIYQGLQMSNGLDWAPDGNTLYLVDTGTKEILAFDFDKENGTVSNARTFLRIPEGIGGPDGMCIDENGDLWCALWGCGYIARISTETAEIKELINGIPTNIIASCNFGGKDLDELFITTGCYPNREGYGEGDGMTYVIRPGVRGVPINRMKWEK